MRKYLMSTTALVAVVLFASTPAATQTDGEKLRITAFAVNMSTIGTGATSTVECDVDRWSKNPSGKVVRIVRWECVCGDTEMIESGPVE